MHSSDSGRLRGRYGCTPDLELWVSIVNDDRRNAIDELKMW
jgi:hypothetical protein